MNVRKRKIQYYFSVEGETEKWYLEWLQRQINSTDNAAYGVVFNVKVEKDPVNRVKGMAILAKTDIWHFSDYESSGPEHVKQFQSTMARMEQAQRLKQVKYHFGYSNLTFDLWMILHKKNCNAAKSHRRQYITDINRAFNEKFEDMHQFKHEDNFKRCLKQLTLENINDAISRAKGIMDALNAKAKPCRYKGFSYFEQNPSLAIWEIIRDIMTKCGLREN